MNMRSLFGNFNFRWSMIPMALIISIVPIVVYPTVIEIASDYVAYFWTSTPQVDMFSYYKAVVLILFAIFGLAAFAFDLYYKKIVVKRSIYYIPMGVYVLFVILSSIFSADKSTSLFGFVGRYEGMFVLLAYMIIMFIAINTGREEKYTMVFLVSLTASASVIGILGVFQYFHVGLADFVPEFTGVYSTFGNSNYVGSYMSMLFPISIALFLRVRKKHFKVLTGLFNILMYINWIGCGSLAGIVGGTFGAIIILAAYRRDMAKNKMYFLFGMIIYLIIFWGMKGFPIYHGPAKASSAYYNRSAELQAGQALEFKDVTLNKEGIRIEFSDREYVINRRDIDAYFQDNRHNSMPVIYDMGKVKFPWGEPRDLYITVFKSDNVETVEEAVYGPKLGRAVRLNFAASDEGFKFVDHRDKAVDLRPIDSWGFEGIERVGSARGYIWSRSIPLLKETVLLGRGPDTFPMYFPQDDYIGKLLNYAVINKFVDKPHNMYLGTALNTGFISLLSLMVIFIIYFFGNFRFCFRTNWRDDRFHLRVAIFAAICGYMISGFFNDSVVSVAPVFWALLGLGVNLNEPFL